MKKLILIACSLCYFLIAQSQTNYYVSKSGNDNLDGLTIATAWKTIQYASYNAGPGSTINILKGTYNENIFIDQSGTPGNPITYRNYQNAEVIISGIGFTDEFSNIIAVNGKSNLVFDGLILEKLTAPSGRGILVLCDSGSSVQNITLRNLKIRNIGYTTIDEVPDTTDHAHAIEIFGAGFTEAEAIKNILIENCEVYNNITGYSENITLNGNINGYAILNNTVHNNKNIGIEVAGNFKASKKPILDHVRNGIISGNITYKNISPVAVSAGIYCDGCQNTIIERNISYENAVGIAAGCEEEGTTDSVIIRENIIYNNYHTGIEIGGYDTANTGIVRKALVHNNSCYFNDTSNLHGQMTIYRTDNCRLFQNILYSNGDLLFYIDKISPQSFSADYNDYFINGGNETNAKVNLKWNTISYGDYLTATGKDDNSIFDDPLFKNLSLISPDLHLTKASHCREAGDPSFISGLGELDIDGESRLFAIVDIGADEYYPTTSFYENNTSLNELKIYPNPAHNSIHIEYGPTAQNQEILFRNTMGQVVKVVELPQSGEIDVSDLVGGLYILAIGSNNYKVIKF